MPIGTLSRGVSLLNLTATSTFNFAKQKFSSYFTESDSQEERYHQFLREQAILIVRELGQLKEVL